MTIVKLQVQPLLTIPQPPPLLIQQHRRSHQQVRRTAQRMSLFQVQSQSRSRRRWILPLLQPVPLQLAMRQGPSLTVIKLLPSHLQRH